MTLRSGAWRRAIPHPGLTRAELDEFIAQAQEDGYIPVDVALPNKGACIEALRTARRAAIDEDRTPRRTAPVVRNLCEISASEVNAWLRSLPPEGLDP